ncbi:hypothetical protein DYI24_12845 [Rhodopseudomonas sp. BR0C11]|uniref:hypothetical protein n=1 Tax=Rhodopseudomonas sp. BR0C11 TaxID=2269370 RepID=UPI0013DF4725|nr:hypothetical protein [Rhodopseudomonas sp. BR0C11]NEV77925.1 hypothetical protein [Rhodopseudomonas sp. BR0C11]
MRLSSVPAAQRSESTTGRPLAERLQIAAFNKAVAQLGFAFDPLDEGRSLVLAGSGRRVRVAIEYVPGTSRQIDVEATLAKARAVRAGADILRDRLETAEAFGRLYDRTRHSLH